MIRYSNTLSSSLEKYNVVSQAVELITTRYQMASLLVSFPLKKFSWTDKDFPQVRLHHIFHKE